MKPHKRKESRRRETAWENANKRWKREEEEKVWEMEWAFVKASNKEKQELWETEPRATHRKPEHTTIPWTHHLWLAEGTRSGFVAPQRAGDHRGAQPADPPAWTYWWGQLVDGKPVRKRRFQTGFWWYAPSSSSSFHHQKGNVQRLKVHVCVGWAGPVVQSHLPTKTPQKKNRYVAANKTFQSNPENI